MNCDPNDVLCNIVNNCSGGIGAGSTLFDYWLTHNCPAAYSQYINTNGNLIEYNPQAICQVQEQIVRLFNTYFETNEITNDVTSPSYSTFQETLLSLCINPTLPGVCQQFLGGDVGYCAQFSQIGATGYCSQFTREETINNPTLINFCGCFVPPDKNYLDLTKNPTCDPLCHRALTSQQSNIATGHLETCPQTICVIDNTTINTLKSEIPGGINFNTVCSGCGGGDGSKGCLCIVSGTNISSTLSQIGVGVNFGEFCGTGSVCLVEDKNGNIISQGACTGINPINVPIDTKSKNYNSSPNLGLIFILGIILLIFFLIGLIGFLNKPKEPYN